MPKYKIMSAPGPVTLPLATTFVDKYMPKANPTFVTVYLYGLRLCYMAGVEADNKKIAEDLDILESDVYKAFQYWESVGIVKLSEDGVQYLDLTLAEPEPKPQKPRYTASEISDIIDNNDEIKFLIRHAEDIFGKTLSGSETSTLLSFYDWLKLPIEVILMLLEHCASLHKTNMRYAEKVAVAWANDGIDTIEKAKDHLKNSEKRQKTARSFKRLFRITGRDISDAEYAHILQWTEDMKMDQALIKAAYEKTLAKTGNISFPYMNAILQSWYRQGICSVDDIPQDEPKKPVPRQRESKFNSFEEKHDYDLDAFEKKSLEKRLG